MLLVVITISDRCSRGEMTDTAGPAVADMLRAQWPSALIEAEMLADDELRIAARLEAASDRSASLVVAAGGTGFGPRDRTPEATLRVIDRQAPGLAECMRAAGAEKNKFAWLSRGVCGLRGTTVIVNLPGSERGATESLACILPLLKHAIEVAAGGNSHPQS